MRGAIGYLDTTASGEEWDLSDGVMTSSSSWRMMVAGGMVRGWANTGGSASTDCPTVYLAPACSLPARGSGPLRTVRWIPQASASASSGLTSTTPPQSVSGSPPSSEAITRQPE